MIRLGLSRRRLPVDLHSVRFSAQWLNPLVVLVALLNPWMTVLIMGILARSIFHENIGRPMLAYALVSFVALFNASKQIEGDWAWYASGYYDLLHEGLFNYLQAGGLSIRQSEPLYYAFSYVLSWLSNGNVLVLAMGISIVIYGVYIYALERLLKHYGLHHWRAAVCIVFAVLAGITFTQSLHLVRQYMAGSFLFLFFLFLMEHKNKKALLCFVCGSLIHNSFVIPALLLVGCKIFASFRRTQKHYFISIVVFLIAGFCIGSIVSNIVGNTIFHAAAFKNDGSISFSVIALDATLFFASVAGIWKLGKYSLFDFQSAFVVVLFLAFYGAFLFAARDLLLMLLRLYFYVEWFRVIGIISIVWFLVYRTHIASLAWLLLPLSFLMISMRIGKSPWDYGGSFFEHLTGTAAWTVDKLL